MKELAILFASIISTEDLINQLQDNIEKYKADPNESNMNRVELDCMLLLSKKTVDASGGGSAGAMKVIDDLNTMERGNELLKTKKN